MFSSAAATRSLSPSCLFTCSAVLCVPSFIRTSTRNLGGSACSSRTLTPRPITVASEQCVMVGVTSTSTVCRSRPRGLMWISGRFTTAREPRERGCSGSEMVEMRSVGAYQSDDLTAVSESRLQTVKWAYRRSLARLSAQLYLHRHFPSLRKQVRAQMDRSSTSTTVLSWRRVRVCSACRLGMTFAASALGGLKRCGW